MLKIRDLVGTVDIRSMPEGAGHEGGAEGSTQEWFYPLEDGPEQQDGDAEVRAVPTPAGECLAWRPPELGSPLLGYESLQGVEVSWQNEIENGRWE